MKLYSIAVIFIFIGSILSCSKTSLSNKSDENIEFATGRQCGWCAGSDSMQISFTKTHYAYVAPCDDSDFKKSADTKSADWNELLKLLDYETFNNINVNSCDVCFDGCDSWISVKKGNQYHRIQFGAGDSAKIQKILPLLNKLIEVKKNYSDKLL